MQLVLRLPRLAIALLILALILVIGVIGYATYLAIGVVAGYLDTNRFVAGLLLAVLFARVPRIHQGRLQTIGLIPKGARPQVMVALLALCALHFGLRGETVPMLVLAIAAVLLLAFQRMKKKMVGRISSFSFRSPAGPVRPGPADDMIIDAEFREKKD